MRLADLEATVSGVSQPFLTVYLEGCSKRNANRHSLSQPHPWLKKLAKALEPTLPDNERKTFRTQLDRVQKFLRQSAPPTENVAIFSSKAKWICLRLPSPVANELSWGKPALSQIYRIAEEQQDICIVLVDLTGARFFRYELGDISEMPAMKFEVDASQWKRKEHGHMAQRHTMLPHGPLRDAFKQRMDEQYRRFFRHIAERTKFICANQNLRAVLLVGSERLTKPIESALPKDIQERTVLVAEDLAKLAPAKLEAKIAPNIAAWMKLFAEARANRMLGSERGTVIGLDETLAQLQKGRIGTLLMVRGLETPLRQCINCGDINRSADPVCAACGGARRDVMLSQVLDQLAKSYRTKVEILDPDAAEQLAKAGGIGGWLRQPTLVVARQN